MRCPACRGKKTVPVAGGRSKCSLCGGSGYVSRNRPLPPLDTYDGRCWKLARWDEENPGGRPLISDR